MRTAEELKALVGANLKKCEDAGDGMYNVPIKVEIRDGWTVGYFQCYPFRDEPYYDKIWLLCYKQIDDKGWDYDNEDFEWEELTSSEQEDIIDAVEEVLL